MAIYFEQPLVALKSGEIVWQPAEAGVTLKLLRDAPQPAKSASLRLVQMRDIARNFSMDLTTVVGKTLTLAQLVQQVLHVRADGVL